MDQRGFPDQHLQVMSLGAAQAITEYGEADGATRDMGGCGAIWCEDPKKGPQGQLKDKRCEPHKRWNLPSG